MKVIEVPNGHYERCHWLVSKATDAIESIIDVGCADAFMFRDVAREKTVFVDNGLAAKEACKGLNFLLVDAHSLPFVNHSFDVAVLGDVLEHVQNPVKVLQEAFRVARKNVLVTVPYEYEWASEARPFACAMHIRFYTENLLRQHLNEAGITNFSIVKIRGGSWAFFAVEVMK